MSIRLAAVLVLLAGPALADEEEQCRAAIAVARDLAASMPSGDLSRRFAEHELDTAGLEMESGEVDDCPESVSRARHIIATRPYVLRPGEVLGVPAPETPH